MEHELDVHRDALEEMPRDYCDRRPKRSFPQKIALKISGLDDALEEEEGGARGEGGGGGAGMHWKRRDLRGRPSSR